MAHFTEYQVRRFRMLFSQYAEDTIVDAEPDDDDMMVTESQADLAQPLKSMDSVTSASMRRGGVKMRSRMKLKQLHFALPRLGPPLSLAVARTIIHRYDSSCVGSLDFHDFLEFLADYEATLEHKKESALRLFHRMKANFVSDGAEDDESSSSGTPLVTSQDRELYAALGIDPTSKFARSVFTAAKTEDEVLAYLNLDDPEFLWAGADSLTRAITENNVITEFVLLHRRITVRVLEAKNLETHLRPKYRRGYGIIYRTMDPIVRVTLAGMSRDTSAQVGMARPEWDQVLAFDLRIPPGETYDVLEWVQAQYFEVQLLDHWNEGATPHTELCARGTVSLLQVLLSTKKPVELPIRMDFPHAPVDNSDKPIVVLQVTDHTQERGTFAKVMDACKHLDEVWLSRHPAKFRKELSSLADKNKKAERAPPALQKIDEDESGDEFQLKQYLKTFDVLGANSASSLAEYLVNFVSPLRHVFRRRQYPLMMLDESNTFRFLPCFLRPLILPRSSGSATGVSPSVTTVAREYAALVATIPTVTTQAPPSDHTQRIMSSLSTHESNRIHNKPTPTSFFLPSSTSGLVHGENLRSQVCTPSTMLTRRYGTAMEHAILLCGLMLGVGIDAYIAIGTSQRCHYVWVVTFTGGSDRSTYESTAVLSRQNGATETSSRARFKQFAELSTITADNAELGVTHWDVLSGKPWISFGQIGFPFERIHVIFNHMNAWLNIQKSALVSRQIFSWNLENASHWMPFLTQQMLEHIKMPACFYDAPHMMHDGNLHSIAQTSGAYLSKFAEEVQLYRQHILLVPETRFHRKISLLMSGYIDKFENAFACRRGLLPIAKGSRQYSFPELLSRLYQRIQPYIPKRHRCVLRVLHLRMLPSKSLIDVIAPYGLFDSSSSSTIYGIAIDRYAYSLGGGSIWLIVAMLLPHL
ncbi:Coiled-coil and C2 domain-containing protein 2A [Sorochytrium milnesiophthora]